MSILKFPSYKYVWKRGRTSFWKKTFSGVRETMARLILIALCSVCLLLESTISLKCRTGIEQANDQYQKIIQVCKKRSTNDNNYNDNSSSAEDDESDNSSIVDVFGTKFFLSDSNNFLDTQSGKDSIDHRNHGNDRKNGNQHSFNDTNENWRNTENSNRDNDNYNFNNPNGDARSNYDQMYNSNSEYNKERKQACVTQCFFNELNVVDERGFPEQSSLIQLMMHNMRNPELQDFIEEAIIECFHYLDSDMRQDKCYHSQNLLICLIDKGKERCEDWNN